MNAIHNDVYEEINQEKLDYLQKKHEWIVKPIYNASNNVLNTPFYEWLSTINN